MAARVVLVRHGESLWNAQGRLQGQGGTGLSELGFAQAEAVAHYLRGAYPTPVRAVRSDLQRTAETAAAWEQLVGVRAEVDRRWREIDVGTWSGLTWDEVAAADPETLASWRGGQDVRRGGGETFAELRTRTWEALTDVAGVDGIVVVFTHGGSIRLGVAAALRLQPNGERALAPVANCSVTEVVVEDGHATLTAYNRVDHLDGMAQGGRR